MPKGLYCRTQADTRQTAKQPSGGEFRACVQLFAFILFVVFRPKVSPPLMSRTVDACYWAQSANDKEHVRTPIRSVLYFNPSSVINLRFFHGQVE
jgi:hypothetical protein